MKIEIIRGVSRPPRDANHEPSRQLLWQSGLFFNISGVHLTEMKGARLPATPVFRISMCSQVTPVGAAFWWGADRPQWLWHRGSAFVISGVQEAETSGMRLAVGPVFGTSMCAQAALPRLTAGAAEVREVCQYCAPGPAKAREARLAIRLATRTVVKVFMGMEEFKSDTLFR